MRERVRRGHEHVVGDVPRAADDGAQPHARENVGVVALARYESLAVELHRVKWTATREQRPPVGPPVRLLGIAFRLGRWIGQRKHNRPLIDARHLLQHLFSEGAADSGDADDGCGLQRLDRAEEVTDRCVVLRVRDLVLGEVGAALDDQAFRVDQPAALVSGGFGQPLRHHGRGYQIGDAGGGFARTQEQYFLVAQLAAGDAQRREQARQHDGCRSLDVVVEGADPVTVLVQQAECVVIGEVLELDHDAREYRARGGDELVDQLVIRGAGDAALPQPDVKRVLEQRLVVGADVNGDRQAQLRAHAGTRDIQGELADRYAHAIRAEVAQAENALAVGDDYDAGLVRPVAQHFRHVSAIVRADENAARALENKAVLLTRQSHRRGVDERLHLVDVVAQDAEEQRFVAVVQGVERDKLVERVGNPAQVVEHARDLLVLAVHVRRQQPAQLQCIAFLLGKRGAFIERGVVQQRKALWQVARRKVFFRVKHGFLRLVLTLAHRRRIRARDPCMLILSAGCSRINLIQIKRGAVARFIVAAKVTGAGRCSGYFPSFQCRTNQGSCSIVTTCPIIAGDRLAERSRGNRRQERLECQDRKNRLFLKTTFISDIIDITYANRQS